VRDWALNMVPMGSESVRLLLVRLEVEGWAGVCVARQDLYRSSGRSESTSRPPWRGSTSRSRSLGRDVPTSPAQLASSPVSLQAGVPPMHAW